MDTEETFFLALKAHRESKSIELDEISDHTKINPKYLNAIEEGNFNIIPSIYMRLFIRSYAKYIDADYKQALVDYELYTTGKIQPKFFETKEDNHINEKKTTISDNNNFEGDFQINYKQAITIGLTIMAIYLGFKLVEFVSNDGESKNTPVVTPPGLSDTTHSQSNINKNYDDIHKINNIIDSSPLTNQDFKNNNLAYQITEIIPLSSNKVNLTIKTLNKTKLNILTHHKDGAVFF